MTEIENSFVSYTDEPTPSPTAEETRFILGTTGPTVEPAFPDSSDLTYSPTSEFTLPPSFDGTYAPTSELTPWPTPTQNYDPYQDGDSALMRAYATIGFIIRILLPVILIVMCCRIKRRRENDMIVDGNGQAAGGGGGVAGRRREPQMDPEERKRYIDEQLCTKKVIGASEGQVVPSYADDVLMKSDVAVPKDRMAVSADLNGSNSNDINNDTWFESEEPSCSICLCVYEPGDTICWSSNTRCTHSFHKDCMAEWLQQHDDCPQCRCDYLKTDSQFPDDGDEEKADGDALAPTAMASNGSAALSASSRSGSISRIQPLELDDGMVDVDLESGNNIGSDNPNDLPWYMETIPGIGLRYSTTTTSQRQRSLRS